MKNAINYYYNLITYDIRQMNKKYRFTVDKSEFLLCHCEFHPDELKEVYELSLSLFQQGVYCHQIVLNNQQGIITYINGEPYILLQLFVTDSRKITLNDVVPFQRFSSTGSLFHLEKTHWRDFWMQKVDYFEYQVSELGRKYPLIRESFSYYVGLSETAIMMLLDFSSNDSLVLSHRRIRKGISLAELYNPLNFILDSKVRDVAEFFKSQFLDKNDILDDIKNYLSTSQFTSSELYLFFVRMMYPSFYFDMYEKVITGVESEERLSLILSSVSVYQKLLRDLYLYLKPYTTFPEIEWLIKT